MQFSTSTLMLAWERSGRMDRDFPRVGDKPGLLQGLELRQSAGHVIGGGVEVPCQLGHLGQGPDEGLVGTGGGSCSPDDFASSGKVEGS